jgi:hypothetical protein
MTQLTGRKRCRILEEYERLGSERKVSVSLGIPRGTCRRWIKRDKETNDVQRKPRVAEPVISDEVAEDVVSMLRSKKYKGAQGVAQQLFSDNKTPRIVNHSTLIRAIRRRAAVDGRKLRAERGKPKVKLLGGDTVKKRLAYCRKEKLRTWSHVLFTDRCKFPFSYPGSVVSPVEWLYDDETRASTMKNHPNVFNVYGGISVHGSTKLVEVAGTTGRKSEYLNKKGEVSKNITSSEYEDVLAKGLLVDAKAMFAANGESAFVLMQDNDPTHNVAGRVVDEFNRKKGTYITLLKHPPNSPDFNPIENVWAYVITNVNKRGCKTCEEFKAAVRQEFKSIKPDTLMALFKSMPRRLAACEKNNGQRTKY